MGNTNYFSKAMESKSLEELEEISKDKANYTDDARLAALWFRGGKVVNNDVLDDF